MNTKTSILMAKARRPLGCGVRKFGILLTVMAAAIIALPNTVTNDVVVATSDAELRISDRGLGLGLEVVGGGAAEVKLEARPGWRFRDGRTAVTLNKAAGEPAKSPDAVGEGQNSEGSATVVIVDGGDDDDENGDGEGSVEHEKPILSMTATAPKVVAYSVQDGGTNVSISLSATVTTKGKHRKLDAEGNVVEEKEFSPKHYVWKMTGVATGEAETDSSTHTFTVNLTKGESKWLNFSVVGKTCSICDGEVESDAATDSVEIDVYELSISRDPYLGLDRTDAGRQSHVVKTATLSSDPSLPSSSSVEWTECGICEFVGAKNQRSVSYQNKDSETASGEYLAERLAASVTLAGMDSAFVCSTNFTVVKVGVQIGEVGEGKEEGEGAFVQYVPDELDGGITADGTNKMVAVSFLCEPELPAGETVTVSLSGPGELYEKLPGGELVKTTSRSYPASGMGDRVFRLHGHTTSSAPRDGQIRIEHLTIGAVDASKYTVVNVDLRATDLHAMVHDRDEDSPGAFVHWNIDNDDDSDNGVGGPKRPGADYLQQESVVFEDDLCQLLALFGPALAEGSVTLAIDSPNARIWKSTDKGADNLVLSGAGARTWNLSDAGARNEFMSLCAGVAWVEGVGEGICDITLAYSSQSGVAACSDKVKYTFVAADCGRQPRTGIEMNTAIVRLPGLKGCEWSITGDATRNYNCIAWSVGINDKWIGEIGPPEFGDEFIDRDYGNGNGILEMSDIDAFYAAKGMLSTASGPSDAAVVVYWGGNGIHAARRRSCGCGSHQWCMFESKCGPWVRIEHVWDQVEGESYGSAVRFYKP